MVCVCDWHRGTGGRDGGEWVGRCDAGCVGGGGDRSEGMVGGCDMSREGQVAETTVSGWGMCE